MKIQDRINLRYELILIIFWAVVASLGFALWLGYQLAFWRIQNSSPVNQGVLESIPLKEQEIQSDEQVKELTIRLGRIEANLMRINALGERLVEHAHLDPKEFNFTQNAGTGGPLLETIVQLDAVLDKRLTQMNTLHQALHSRLGQEELSLYGAGKPVVDGWISSFFGHRHDPFTGRKAWHAGVDIVGKEGAEVRALAGGVVSFADVKGAYGRLVEINHGKGLVTRYGHNKELRVRPGQLVKKGQTIALLGSSGRSTGPHLHLEVHQNGEPVDPGHFIKEFRKH
jgi:murein DD-endopeptidase MepM/ murein hydrolase activator NlpD